MKPQDIQEIIATLKEARECIEDLGSGKGGWAWEEVMDRIEHAIALTSTEDRHG